MHRRKCAGNILRDHPGLERLKIPETSLVLSCAWKGGSGDQRGEGGRRDGSAHRWSGAPAHLRVWQVWAGPWTSGEGLYRTASFRRQDRALLMRL